MQLSCLTALLPLYRLWPHFHQQKEHTTPLSQGISGILWEEGSYINISYYYNNPYLTIQL